MSKVVLAFVALMLCGTAHAFTLVTDSDNPMMTDSELRAMTMSIAAAVGHQIPDVPQIKVVVMSRAKSSSLKGRWLYRHRVQLTKVFDGGAPYPFQGWLPIHQVELYGTSDAVETKAKLEEALRTFFQSIRNVDPAKASPR